MKADGTTSSWFSHAPAKRIVPTTYTPAYKNVGHFYFGSPAFPVVPFSPLFGWEGSPKIENQQKKEKTVWVPLFVASQNLEDLAFRWFFGFVCKRLVCRSSWGQLVQPRNLGRCPGVFFFFANPIQGSAPSLLMWTLDLSRTRPTIRGGEPLQKWTESNH